MTEPSAAPRYLRMRAAAKILLTVAGLALILSFVVGISDKPELQNVARATFILLGTSGAALWGRSIQTEAIDLAIAADLEAAGIDGDPARSSEASVEDFR